MKRGIHPKVYKETKVICACGNTFTTQSTLEEINVAICSLCHPYFTGEKKYIDEEGRIEKFEKKLKRAEAKKQTTVSKKKKSSKKQTADKPKETYSLKEMLEKARRPSKNQ